MMRSRIKKKRQDNKRKMQVLFTIAIMLLVTIACGKKEPTMIQVPDGFGDVMQVELQEGVPAMEVDPADFYKDGEYINYAGDDRTALRGVDVSSFQEDIDWEAVRADGVEFAMIRIGRRGYGPEGSLGEDTKYRQNIAGAKAAGLKVGVYFFSQAVDVAEAEEEAKFVLDILDGESLDFPVAFEWERINFDVARTDDVTGTAPTDFALAFCDIIKQAGYETMIYFTRSMAYFEHDLTRLSDVGIKFWSSSVGDTPDFYYDHYIWQYSITGKVKGIGVDVDLNLCFE
jgi:GH25 family lysozyme M1 (1,4-beta-N-acetylmuramidase)